MRIELQQVMLLDWDWDWDWIGVQNMQGILLDISKIKG